MWSSKYQKNVFIDLGFACTVKEEIGKLTKTKYFGTMNYCSY